MVVAMGSLFLRSLDSRKSGLMNLVTPPSHYSLDLIRRRISAVMFPNDDETPPQVSETPSGIAVTFDITFQLLGPPRGIRYR